jgi:sigma-B regulation protein RsbU (phosphoserine phosphatase)
LARYTVRAEALRTTEPSVVLSRLHDVLVRNHPDQFCTAVFLRVEQAGDGRLRATVSAGGHPLPLRVRRGSRSVETVGAAGSMLGMLERAVVSDASTDLVAGDVLVLYTDGITEARRDDEFFGDERLRAVVADAGDATAQELADVLVAAAVDFQDGTPRDDIAVLVLRVT